MTASIVEIIIGKNAVIKIMNIAGLSPIPNHIIANGIHDIGDIVRNACTIGSRAVLKKKYVPIKRPSGIAKTEANKNPARTLYKDAIICFQRTPVCISSKRAENTLTGDGSIDSLTAKYLTR